MTPRSIDRGTMRTAAELAGRAPSLHDTQPWRLGWAGPTVRLVADRTRQLPGSDPDGRELLLSCGVALHHLRSALAALDVATVVERFPDHTDADHVATVHLYQGAGQDNGLAELAGAIVARQTDRRFADRPVEPVHIDELRATVAGEGAVLWPLPSTHAQNELVAAMSETRIAVDDDVPSGLPPREPGGLPGGPRFPTGSLRRSPDQSDGASLLLVGTRSDDVYSRLRAGEATSAALLRASTLGLACAPLSQDLEAPATRVAIAERVLVDPRAHPQMVLRIGWPRTGAEPLLPTPRRAVDDYFDDLRTEGAHQ